MDTIRPSPPTGRYRMLQEKSGGEIAKNKEKIEGDTKGVISTKSNNDEEEMIENGICFHWDKDEDLRLLMDGKMYIHPHLSTVTYLSDIGAPTLALNYRVNALTGEYIPLGEDESVEGYLAWPRIGKHLSFDGRFLHAAPSGFMKKGFFEKQIEIPLDQLKFAESTQDKKILERRHRRVTLLVNIWLNYVPFNVNVFPESMIDKLSKVDPAEVSHILFKNDDKSKVYENEKCDTDSHVDDGSPLSNPENGRSFYQDFEWSMGSNCDENDRLSMRVPIEMIRSKVGGNVELSWEQKQGIRRRIDLSKVSNEMVPQEAKKQRIE